MDSKGDMERGRWGTAGVQGNIQTGAVNERGYVSDGKEQSEEEVREEEAALSRLQIGFLVAFMRRLTLILTRLS